MISPHTLRTAGAVVALSLVLALPARAQFTKNTADIPIGSTYNGSYSENVDFGDVDLDGDWDALFADGGDQGNDQNRLWINMGGAQGGSLGVMRDVTGSRLPSTSDDSRDVEFVDFDGDGDLDSYTSNTSQIQNQTNRWLVNLGLDQGGQLGYYADETSTRWTGLSGPGSSVSPGLVLPSGGFVDWSCDCDFGDVDNDGDMDLFHSTYGANFGGVVPSRIFLNDGDGFFHEFNPSGFLILGTTLNPGQPALWCEGTFQPNTSNTTGLQADICTNTLDIDLGDIDGDFDLDVLHGDRDAAPRFFHNRLEENGGTPADLGFRDVSHMIYPPNWSSGGGNYEQEMADIDGDGDLDLYGLNWGSNAGNDRMFRNNGGVFGNVTTLPNSGSDDNEGDFVDFDNDGDLDLYVANFSGADRLYRNVDTGSGQPDFNFTGNQNGTSAQSLDADAADIDGDGDYDVIVAMDVGAPNVYMQNTTQKADVHAPYLPRIEGTADRSASTVPSAVRAQVYDNAPYYTTWYNPTVLEVTVEGCRIPDVGMVSSGGQIFRGELPGNLLGTVQYDARSQDGYGNAGSSATESYVASDVPGGSFDVFGIDSGAGAPVIAALSVAFPGETLHVGASGMTPGNAWFLAWNQSKLATPISIPGQAIANVAGQNFFLYTGAVDAAGCAVQSIALPPSVPSVATYFQMFEFPGDGADLLDSSRGLEVTIQ